MGQREKKRLERLKKAGKEKEHIETMAKAKRKRKYDSESEDTSEEDDSDAYKESKKRKKKHKTKKNRSDTVNREFEKYSSGSEEDEDGPDFESPEENEIIQDKIDDDLFKSDHEFSCESDVPDTEATIVKHARTATKGGKKKRGRPPKVAKMESDESEEEEEEEEEEEFVCQK